MTRWLTVTAFAALAAGGTARGVELDPTAVDLKIADDARSGDARFTGIDFGASDRFQHAWLVLHYTSRGPCPALDGECELDAPLQVKVPGLSYDPAGERVVYEAPGAEPVVCAIGKRGALAATGKCTTRVVHVDRVVDNGFDGRRDRREEIHFTVHGS